MVRRERVFRHERGATNAPLRVNNCQFALGFENTNMRKNCRPPRRRSGAIPKGEPRTPGTGGPR